MKTNIFFIFMLLLGLTSCSTQSTKKPTTTTENNRSVIIIDLDKEVKSNTNLRGKDTLLINTPIYIGDNDEVSFKGDYLKKESPIKLKIGDNDEVAFTGDHYTIETMQLRNGDIIQMRGKAGNTFLEIEVVR